MDTQKAARQLTGSVMDNNNWARAKELFVEMLELPQSERENFLAINTKDQPQLKALVEELLEGESISNQEAHSVSKLVGNEASEVLKDNHIAKKGDTIAEYQIEEIIGEGGMGLVYSAKRVDAKFDQTVAIKIIQSHALVPQTIERFVQERQILASLQHPNIAQLIGGGETQAGLPYIVMEYIEGINIVDYCKAHALSTRARLDLFKQVMSALNYAHQNLIIHRDIKPSNVLVNAQGNVKLLDFGIAKLIEEKALPEDNHLTSFEVKVLTPANASPEQVKREKVTTRTDVYGLSTLLYQMLTEQALFDTSSATSREVESWIVDKEPTKPSESVSTEHSLKHSNLKSTLSGDLDTIILKGLQKNPERRYSSVEQFSQDIQYYLTDYPIHAKPDSAWYKLTKFYQRNKAFSLVTSLLFLCLVGFTSVVTYQAFVIEQARVEAVRESNNARQISSFLTDTFTAANPYYSGDKQVTPKDLVDNALLQINEVDTDPLLKLQLLVTIADVYKSIGNLEKAQEVLEDAEAFKSENDDIPKLVAYKMDILGADLEIDLGSIEKAKELNLQVFNTLKNDYELAFSSGISEESHASLTNFYVSALLQRSSILDRLGDDEQALTLTLNALDIAKAESSTSVRNLTNIYIGLGHTYRKLLNYEESAKWLVKSLDYAKLNFGEFNLETAYSYNQLASTYYNIDKLDEALDMAKKGLEIRQTLFPDGNAEIAASLGMIANIYYTMKETETAIQYRKQAVVEVERALGDEHVYFGAVNMALASDLINVEQYDEARKYLLIAMPVMENNVPEDSIDYVRPIRLLGKLDYHQAKYEEALSNLQLSLVLATSAEPNGHWITGEVHSYLALTQAKLHQAQIASSHKKEAIDLFREIFGEGSVRYENMVSLLSDI